MVKWLLKISLFFLNYSQIFRLFAFLNRKKVVVLMYHGITKDDLGKRDRASNHVGLPLRLQLKKFRQQMRYISNEYNIISLDALVSAIIDKTKLPPYSVLLTFDDGYRNNYTHAFPVLKSLKIPVTIFLTTDFIGTQKAFWWDRVEYAIRNTRQENIKVSIDSREVNLSLRDLKNKISSLAYITKLRKTFSEEEGKAFIEDVIRKLDSDLNEVTQKEEDYLALDWGKVKKMKNSGVSFGSHTANHVILTRCSKEQAEKEVHKSKEKIEELLEEECKFFAYPSGKFDKVVKQIVMQAGFLCALTTIPGMNDLQQTDPYEIKRIAISSSDDFLSFLGKLTGTTSFLLKLRNRLISKFKVNLGSTNKLDWLRGGYN